MSVLAAKPPHRPFDPHQGETEHNECDDVGNQKGTTAILGRLSRKPQKISQADSISGHCQNQSDP